MTDACGPPTPPVPRPRTRQGGGLGSGCSRPLPAASGAGPWAEDTLRPVTFAQNKRIRSPVGSPGSGRGPTPAGFAFPAVKDHAVEPPGAPGLVTAALSSDSSPFSQGKLDSGPLLGCGAAWGKWGVQKRRPPNGGQQELHGIQDQRASHPQSCRRVGGCARGRTSPPEPRSEEAVLCRSASRLSSCALPGWQVPRGRGMRWC